MANRAMQAKRLKMARERRAWAKAYQRRTPKPPNREAIQHYAAHARGLEDNQFVDSPPPKISAKQKQQALLELMMPIDCDMSVRGPTVPDIFQESLIYFNPTKTKFVLVIKDLEQKLERISIVFSSKELLIMCWEMDRVCWIGNRSIG
jgi:hypothetical protein